MLENETYEWSDDARDSITRALHARRRELFREAIEHVDERVVERFLDAVFKDMEKAAFASIAKNAKILNKADPKGEPIDRSDMKDVLDGFKDHVRVFLDMAKRENPLEELMDLLNDVLSDEV